MPKSIATFVLVVIVDCGVPEQIELLLNLGVAYVLVMRPPFPSQAKVDGTHSFFLDTAQKHCPTSCCDEAMPFVATEVPVHPLLL